MIPAELLSLLVWPAAHHFPPHAEKTGEPLPLPCITILCSPFLCITIVAITTIISIAIVFFSFLWPARRGWTSWLSQQTPALLSLELSFA